MTMPAPTMNDDGMKNSLMVSAGLHLVGLLFLFFGLPYLMPPLPEHHDPVPFQIVEIADLTNTKLKDEEPQPPKPAPQPEPPPPPQQQPQQTVTPPPQPEAVKPPPEAEALKAAPLPKPKPKPPEAKPQNDEFSKLLKNLEANKKTEAPKVQDSKPDSKTPTQPVTSQASSLSNRLTISEEDALRRQIESCWNPDLGARNAQDLVVQLLIHVNSDKTVQSAEILDKARYASDSYFRAAADRAVRAVQNPQCSPLILPEGKYDQWKDIHFTFDPRDML